MISHGLNVGGEPSGHLILGDHVTTGDALIAALHVLAAMLEEDKPASEALRLFTPVPQILKNIKFSGSDPLVRPEVIAGITDIESRLGKTGRIVVRPSGTEPLIRIMIEGDDHTAITAMADELADVINRAA